MSLMQQATEIWQSATERATKKSAAIAGATIVSIWVAVKLYRRRYNESAPPGYKARKDLVVPPGLPIIGNLHQMSISQLIERIENWAWYAFIAFWFVTEFGLGTDQVFRREYGKAYKVYVGLAPLVILSSTTAIDQFFKERPLNIRRSSDTEKLFEDSNIAGLFSMEGT
jgi:hypothetical protein